MITQEISAIPAREALVLEYLGDGNARDTNDGTKATLTATNVSYASCPVGYQKQWGVFNGSSSKVTAPSSSAYNFSGTGGFELQFFCKMANVSSGLLLHREDVASDFGGYIVGFDTGNTFFFRIRNDSNSSATVSASSASFLNTPKMLSARYDGTTIKIFDGVTQIGSTDTTLSVGATSSGLGIGSTFGGGGYGNGNIVCRIFNRPLTESERLAYWHEFNRKLAGGSDFGAYIPQPTAYLDAVGEDTFYDVQNGTKATRTAGTVANDNIGLARAISGPNQSWASVAGDHFTFLGAPIEDTTSIATSNDISGGNLSHGITIYANVNCTLTRIDTIFGSSDFSNVSINGTNGTKSGSSVTFNYSLVAGNSYTISIVDNTINFTAYSYPSLPINDTNINVTAYNFLRIGISGIVTNTGTSWSLQKNYAATSATGINTANTVGAVFYWPTGVISTTQQTYIENVLKSGTKPYAFRRSILPSLTKGFDVEILPALTAGGMPIVIGGSVSYGTVTGSPKVVRAQQNNSILCGNGAYASCPGISLANKSFSLVFWAKDAGTDERDNEYFCLGTTSTRAGLNIMARGTCEKVTFGFYNDDLDSTNVVKRNGWTHWAMVYDSVAKKQYIYRDGAFDKSRTTGGDFTGTGNLIYGAWFMGYGAYTKNLDSLGIAYRVMTGDEIRAHRLSTYRN